MGTMLDKLFQLMAEKKASDIFVSVGAPITSRSGQHHADQPADHGSPRPIQPCSTKSSPEQIERFEGKRR
jgi:twitching motility protein PilU